jgi:Na+-driven multidrug efflux pump
LRTIPLACLLGSMFLLVRPVFEAMGRGRPGLVMAIVRYGVLMLPLALGGMYWAEQRGFPPIDGLIVGLLIASTVSSAAFYAWLRQVLSGVAHGR